MEAALEILEEIAGWFLSVSGKAFFIWLALTYVTTVGDFISDTNYGIGWIDDLAVMTLVLLVFRRKS
jgi:uncharacterized membrane protein YkvA (DUF1232 family)